MNQESKSALSHTNARRMQAWANTTYPTDAADRCAVVSEYLAQLDHDVATALIKRGWPEVFAEAEREWPEAFSVQPAEPSEA
jgi:hypothetical protein